MATRGGRLLYFSLLCILGSVGARGVKRQTWGHTPSQHDDGLPYKSLGCWKDKDIRAIPTLEGNAKQLDNFYTLRLNAIRKCYEAAKERGFKVFAVQHGGWCASSVDAIQTYQKYGKANNCAEDGEGGVGASQVYEIQWLPYKNLGCWKDTAIRAILSLEGNAKQLDKYYAWRHDAIRKCYEAAKERGFKVFALQHGGWCASSADAIKTYQKYGKANNCAKDGGGGAWANEVYEIQSSTPTTTVQGTTAAPTITNSVVPYKNLGCWKDTAIRAIPTLEGNAKQLDKVYTLRHDAIRKCYEAAKERGFKVFAVQNGGWCASSADAMQTYRNYGKATNCPKDGEGGAWANEVYEIQYLPASRTNTTVQGTATDPTSTNSGGRTQPMDITTSPPTGKEKDHAILDSSKDSIPDEELNNDISNLNIQESAAGPGINITDTEGEQNEFPPIPARGLPFLNRLRAGLLAEARTLTTASHLEMLCDAGRPPRWAYGIGPMPSYIAPIAKDLVAIRRRHALEFARAVASSLRRSSLAFEKHGAALNLITTENVYTNDGKGFEWATTKLTALFSRDNGIEATKLKKREELISGYPTTDDDIVCHLKGQNVAGSSFTGETANNAPQPTDIQKGRDANNRDANANNQRRRSNNCEGKECGQESRPQNSGSPLWSHRDRGNGFHNQLPESKSEANSGRTYNSRRQSRDT